MTCVPSGNVSSRISAVVLQRLPSKEVVYAAALDFMPEIKSSQLAVNSADDGLLQIE